MAETTPATARETKRVLVLYSLDKGHPGHILTDQGIGEVLRANNAFDVQLFTEYLDMTRFPDPAQTRSVADFLRRKYANLKIDAIITLYPTAVDLLLSQRPTLFPDVPIIAGEVTRSYAGSLDYAPERRRITGTILGDNASGVLAAALRTKPHTKRFALVAGTSPLDVYAEQLFRDALKKYAGRIELVDLTKLSMPETLKRVAALPPDTIVLYSAIFRDGAGHMFSPRDVLTLVSRAANAPVFYLYDTGIGHGSVGGHLVSMELQGKAVADLALRVLAGEPPAAIPFGGEDAYVNLYDWRELKRWQIPESAIPTGSIIQNKPPTMWEQYKLIILITLFFIVVQTALIIVLVVQLRRKKIAELALIKAEEKYRRIFEGALEGIFETSLQGDLLTANPALARMLGYESPEDIISTVKDIATQVWLTPDARADFVRRHEQQIIRDFECRLRRKDGTIIWASMSSQKVRGPDGRTFCYSGFIEDHTERKRAEAEAGKLRDDLAHITRVAVLGELTSSLAHEVNQPLTAILSNAQAALRFLVQDQPDLNELAEILQDIIRDDNRAAEVIRKIRSMLKKEESSFESVSMNTIIEETLNVVRNDIALMSVTIEKNLDPSLPVVQADRIQLQQVILNLVLNAADAMKETAPNLRRLIVRTQKQDDHCVLVSVIDVGSGIREVQVSRLFDPFYTTKDGGLGMGLAISRNIIMAHKGAIWAENNPEYGATFSFTVPFDDGVRP
jgi:PAS domain S-box-containing protein